MFEIKDIDKPVGQQIFHYIHGEETVFNCPRSGDTGNASLKLADPGRDLINADGSFFYKKGEEVTLIATDEPGNLLVKRWGGYIDEQKYSKEKSQVLDVNLKGYGEAFKRGNITKTYYNFVSRDGHVLLDDWNSTINIGGNEWLAQSFIPTYDAKIIKGKFWMKYWTGTEDIVTMALQADVAGAPSGFDLASITIPAFSDFPTWTWREFLIESPYQLNRGTTYWLVLSSPGASTTTTYFVGADTDNHYTDGIMLHSDNAGGAWHTPNSEEWWLEIANANADQVGENTSICYDEDGEVHITHVDWTVGPNQWDLLHTYGRLGNWTTEVVTNPGYYNSICVDKNGTLHISYWNNGVPQALYHAYKPKGGAWSIEAVDDPANNVGEYNCIICDENNVLHIAYHDSTARDLKYAYGTPDASGSVTWNTEVVDNSGITWGSVSIAIDSGGILHISYIDQPVNHQVKHAYGTTGNWNLETVYAPGGAGLERTSIIIDSKDIPHICFWDSTNNDVRYAYKGVTGGWQNENIDPGANRYRVYWGRNIAVDSQDIIHISYRDQDLTALKHAYGTTGSWDLNIADNAGNCGSHNCIVIDKDVVHIGYNWWNTTDLKYAQFIARNSRDNIFEVYLEPPTYDDIVRSIAYPMTLPPYNFTLGGVDTFGYIAGIEEFNGNTYFECLNKLAKDAKADWWVDINKQLNFKKKENKGATVDTLSDILGGNLTKINRAEQKGMLCNKVTVKGKGNQVDVISAISNQITYADSTNMPGTATPYSIGDQISYLNMPDGFLATEDIGTVGLVTTLNSTTIKLTDQNNDFPYAGVVKIDDELIAYSGVSGECLLNCVRGANGTTIQKHFNNAQVVALEVYQNQMQSDDSDNFNDNNLAGWNAFLSGASAGSITNVSKLFQIDVEEQRYGVLVKQITLTPYTEYYTIVGKVKVSDNNCGPASWMPCIAVYWDRDNWVKGGVSWDGVNYKGTIQTNNAGAFGNTDSANNLNPNQWYWIKVILDVAGVNGFKAYYSKDGITWTSIGDRTRNGATHVGGTPWIIIGKGISDVGAFPGIWFQNDGGAPGVRSVSYIDGFTIFRNTIPYVDLDFGVTCLDTTGMGAVPHAGQVTVNGELIDYESTAATQFRCPTCRVGTRKGSILGRGGGNSKIIRQIRDEDRITDAQYTEDNPAKDSSIYDNQIHAKEITNYNLDKIEDLYKFGGRFVDAYDWKDHTIAPTGVGLPPANDDPIYGYTFQTNRVLTDADSHELINTTCATYNLALTPLEITKLSYHVGKRGIYCSGELGDIVPSMTGALGETKEADDTRDQAIPIGLGDVTVYNNSDNCDSSHALRHDVKIPEGTQEVKKVELSYNLERYRVFSLATNLTTDTGWNRSYVGINNANWTPPIAAPLLWAGKTSEATFAGVYEITTNMIAQNSYLVNWRVRNTVTGAILCQVSTICYHKTVAADRSHAASFWMKYYGDLNGQTIQLEVQDNGGGVGGGGGNVIDIASWTYIDGVDRTPDYSIVEAPTGAWAVSDISILIDDKDVTQEIEAEMGHTLAYEENENEKNIDITRYLNTVGVHKVEIQPDGICRVNSSVTPILRYSY